MFGLNLVFVILFISVQGQNESKNIFYRSSVDSDMKYDDIYQFFNHNVIKSSYDNDKIPNDFNDYKNEIIKDGYKYEIHEEIETPLIKLIRIIKYLPSKQKHTNDVLLKTKENDINRRVNIIKHEAKDDDMINLQVYTVKEAESTTINHVSSTDNPKYVTDSSTNPTMNEEIKETLTGDFNQTEKSIYQFEFICPRYVRSFPLNIDEMTDLWETVYYDMLLKINCFKMHIRKVNESKRIKLEKKYGNFEGKVNWEKCILEIVSCKKGRHHYLQGDASTGVLENIIISETSNANRSDTNAQLRQETSHQWIVVKNLLLMRDCETGNIVVFVRIPYKPQRKELKEALKTFGEDFMFGRFACEVNQTEKTFDKMYDAESDETLFEDEKLFQY